MQVTFVRTGNVLKVTVWKSGQSKKLMPKASLEVDLSQEDKAREEVASFLDEQRGFKALDVDL